MLHVLVVLVVVEVAIVALPLLTFYDVQYIPEYVPESVSHDVRSIEPVAVDNVEEVVAVVIVVVV